MQKMKAITVCSTGASVTGISGNGGSRISRNHRTHNNNNSIIGSGNHSEVGGENAEMKMYLSKLKDLVPFMPKNRKLSKLEIIQHVIDYICDLQSELETHPAINSFDAAAALNSIGIGAGAVDMDGSDERINFNNILMETASSAAVRQPLVDRQTPNTILSATHLTHPMVVSAFSSLSSNHVHTTTDKSTDSSRNC